MNKCCRVHTGGQFGSRFKTKIKKNNQKQNTYKQRRKHIQPFKYTAEMAGCCPLRRIRTKSVEREIFPYTRNSNICVLVRFGSISENESRSSNFCTICWKNRGEGCLSLWYDRPNKVNCTVLHSLLVYFGWHRIS